MRTILFDLVIFLTLFIAAEIALRVFTPETKRLIFTENITGGHEISYNEYGLRDEAFPIQKPRTERRILALGNSTTFGSGVAASETWPKALQEKLGKKWRVINAGGQGSTLPEAIKFLEDTGLEFDPEIIILGVSPSMITASKAKRSSFMPIHKALHASYAYSAFDFYVRKNLYRLGILRDDLNALYPYSEEAKEDYERFTRDLLQLQKLAQEKNIDLLLVGIPASFEVSDTPQVNPRRFPLDQIRIHPLKQIANTSKKTGMVFTDLTAALRAVSDPYIEGDYTHLNAQGHEAAAQAILQRILLLSSRAKPRDLAR